MIEVRESDIHGKGAFATEFIEKGTILHCDVLQVSHSKMLEEYIFPFRGGDLCIHIGFASFLNSSLTPNLKHVGINTQTKISFFEVLEDIESGTELTLNYLNK